MHIPAQIVSNIDPYTIPSAWITTCFFWRVSQDGKKKLFLGGDIADFPYYTLKSSRWACDSDFILNWLIDYFYLLVVNANKEKGPVGVRSSIYSVAPAFFRVGRLYRLDYG